MKKTQQNKTKCSLCNRGYIYNYKKGHTRAICNSCMANRHSIEKKEKAIEYKGGKCFVCGYKKSRWAMCFHHLDPKEKDFSIGMGHCLSWESLKKELDKTVMLCNNCHMEAHSGLIVFKNDMSFDVLPPEDFKQKLKEYT